MGEHLDDQVLVLAPHVSLAWPRVFISVLLRCLPSGMVTQALCY
jgi:hypothetical protein